MLHIYARVSVLAITLMLMMNTAAAQTAGEPSMDQPATVGVHIAGGTGFDTGIKSIRDIAVPGFSCRYDDYLQYAPAAVMLGMKACGYESRTGWGRMAVSDAFSAALMAGMVNGLKYTVRRPRPDGTSANSFPSGHTATAFMIATMMHKEYGLRSPWFSFGAYTMATATAMGRILNNRHWASDILAGAAVGIAATQLGYYLTDLIFKDRYLSESYTRPRYEYDPYLKEYEAGLYFGYRFFPGNRKNAGNIPHSGSSVGIQAGIPLSSMDGIAIRTSANSISYADGRVFNMYNAAIGGYWQWHFARILSVEARLMLGYAWHQEGNGIDLAAGPALSVVSGENFRLRLFAEYETFSFTDSKPMVHTIQTGFGAAFFW